MIKTVRNDFENLIVGSALRRAGDLLGSPEIRYDPQLEAGLNDLVFGELLPTPLPTSLPNDQSEHNWLERCRQGESGQVEIELSGLTSGPCLGVVGNRYAAPYLIGGLHHPITGSTNGAIRGGVEVDSLFGVNVLGFVNQGVPPEQRVKVRILGTAVDSSGRAWNLRSFREPWEKDLFAGVSRSQPEELNRDVAEPGASGAGCRQIVVAGHATNAGKTLCARALVRGLRARGYSVTLEKKSGTACCRDWLSCLLDRTLIPPIRPGAAPTRISINLHDRTARDFVDTLGVVSDVSLPPHRFARESARFTVQYLQQAGSDFHVVELADGSCHTSNRALLETAEFRSRIAALVYCPLPHPEAVAHFLDFWARLGPPANTPVILSGPLANEPRYQLERLEVRHRLGTAVIPSAVPEGDGWEPSGEELAAFVVEALEPGRLERRRGTSNAERRGW